MGNLPILAAGSGQRLDLAPQTAGGGRLVDLDIRPAHRLALGDGVQQTHVLGQTQRQITLACTDSFAGRRPPVTV